jgi:hypothetical protein
MILLANLPTKVLWPNLDYHLRVSVICHSWAEPHYFYYLHMGHGQKMVYRVWSSHHHEQESRINKKNMDWCPSDGYKARLLTIVGYIHIYNISHEIFPWVSQQITMFEWLVIQLDPIIMVYDPNVAYTWLYIPTYTVHIYIYIQLFYMSPLVSHQMLYPIKCLCLMVVSPA